jgi:hypothetical protein
MTTGVMSLLQNAHPFATSVEGRILGTPGPTEWVLVGAAWLCVAAAIFACAKYFLRPGEDDSEHIKRRVLRDVSARSSDPSEQAIV